MDTDPNTYVELLTAALARQERARVEAAEIQDATQMATHVTSLRVFYTDRVASGANDLQLISDLEAFLLTSMPICKAGAKRCRDNAAGAIWDVAARINSQLLTALVWSRRQITRGSRLAADGSTNLRIEPGDIQMSFHGFYAERRTIATTQQRTPRQRSGVSTLLVAARLHLTAAGPVDVLEQRRDSDIAARLRTETTTVAPARAPGLTLAA